MFDDITRREWERWESIERCFREHPGLYRLRLMALFVEGFLVGLLLLGIVVWLVLLCVAQPARRVRLIVFLVANLLVTGKTYLSLLSHRPGSGLPALSEKDWPRLHALIRETTAAVGSPRIHRVFLDPNDFNAYVSSSFPLVPGLRRNVLILGYPLLAAFGSRGLRGVLAHELGHVAHHDTVHGNLLFYIRAFWVSVELGIFTWALVPWRRSYLRRLARLLSPVERERELAADRAIAERFGLDTLRETLVTLTLRDGNGESEKLFRTLMDAAEGTSPAATIRAALRGTIPPDLALRRLERALRSIRPPMEEHPPLAIRAGTTNADELLSYADAPQNAMEEIFGSDDALDAIVDGVLSPLLATASENFHKDQAHQEERLAGLPADATDPDAVIERVGILQALDRKDEAEVVLRAGRAAHPDNAALEVIELCDALKNASSAEEGAPLAKRLEELVDAEPLMRLWAEDPLFTHYLEVGDVDRIKGLLDLRQHGEKALLKRLNAKLRPTDDLRAMPLSKTQREKLASAFAGRQVREVYPVLRLYKGTGTSSSFFVVRWRFLADSTTLGAYDSAVGEVRVVAGTHALFRRFAELGIEPIPVPRKAPKEKEQ